MPVRRSYGARLRLTLLLIATSLAGSSGIGAQTPAPEDLTLEAAQRLAVEGQPLLEAQRDAALAQRERAVAARQLPDPELEAALNELPANGSDAWSLSRDSDTDAMIGFTQEFPRAAKRRLQGERAELLAAQGQSELDELERRLRRDAGLAFLDAHHAERSAVLAEQMLKTALLERYALEARVRSNAATQADLLAAEVEAGLLQDRIAELRQMAASTRRQLARWIGPSAQQPLAFEHGLAGEVPGLASLTAQLVQHPSMRVLSASEAAAAADVALARQGYRPDWRLEVGYGYRPDFPEMLTLRAAVDLPIFRRNRQDREVAAARRDLAAAASRREDRLRAITAELGTAHDDWRLLGERAAAFEARVLPQARTRLDAATAAYRAGRGSLPELIAARRALLDVELRALELNVERERKRLAIDYFAPDGARP